MLSMCADADLPECVERRRGRPRVSDNPKHRRKHIECAGLRIRSGWPLEKLARTYDCSIQTIYNWIELALKYDDQESEGLRRFVDRN